MEKAKDKSPIDGRVEQDGVRRVSLARETATSLPGRGVSLLLLAGAATDMNDTGCTCRRRRHGRVVSMAIACRACTPEHSLVHGFDTTALAGDDATFLFGSRLRRAVGRLRGKRPSSEEEAIR